MKKLIGLILCMSFLGALLVGAGSASAATVPTNYFKGTATGEGASRPEFRFGGPANWVAQPSCGKMLFEGNKVANPAAAGRVNVALFSNCTWEYNQPNLAVTVTKSPGSTWLFSPNLVKIENVSIHVKLTSNYCEYDATGNIYAVESRTGNFAVWTFPTALNETAMTLSNVTGVICTIEHIQNGQKGGIYAPNGMQVVWSSTP